MDIASDVQLGLSTGLWIDIGLDNQNKDNTCIWAGGRGLLERGFVRIGGYSRP